MLRFPLNSPIQFVERNATRDYGSISTPDNTTIDKTLLNLSGNINLEGRQLFSFPDNENVNSQFVIDSDDSISDIYLENRFGQKIKSLDFTETISTVDSTLTYIDFQINSLRVYGLTRVVIISSVVDYESQYFTTSEIDRDLQYMKLEYGSTGVNNGFDFSRSGLCKINAKISFIKESPIIENSTTSQGKNISYLISSSYRRQLTYSAELCGSSEASRFACLLQNDNVFLNNDKILLEKIEFTDSGVNGRLSNIIFTISLLNTGDYYSTNNIGAPKSVVLFGTSSDLVSRNDDNDHINYN